MPPTAQARLAGFAGVAIQPAQPAASAATPLSARLARNLEEKPDERHKTSSAQHNAQCMNQPQGQRHRKASATFVIIRLCFGRV